jgi:competence protein ComEA
VQLDWSEFKQYLVPAFVVLIGLVGWVWLQTPTQTQINTASVSPSPVVEVNSVVTVYVTGKVLHPGVIELPFGSRVIDAIKAAGGTTIKKPNLNLARLLVDGEQILVKKLSADPISANGKINLNTADLAALENIAGVGPVMAQRIIDYRNTNGSFRSLADLDAISGIGPSLMAEFQNSAVVE